MRSSPETSKYRLAFHPGARSDSGAPQAMGPRHRGGSGILGIFPKGTPPMREYSYTTPHGIQVARTLSKIGYRRGLKHLLRDLDRRRGVYFSSGYEYPGRYSRWDFGSICPPFEIVSYDRRVEFRALNERGRRIVEILHPVLTEHPHWESFEASNGAMEGRLKPLPALFPEEER